jgi:hypothetical protein
MGPRLTCLQEFSSYQECSSRGKVGKACGEGRRQCLVAHGLLP